MKNEKKSGLVIFGLILGVIGICLSFFPIINNAAFILGVLAVLFSIVCLIKKESKGKSIAALILGLLAIIITLSLQASWSKSINDSIDNLNGNKTEQILANDVDVTIGNFSAIDGEYGLNNTDLPVTVKNKATESKSFDITIEAVDANGTRIDDDVIYANNLAAGQAQKFDIFTYVSSEKYKDIKSATFKVLEISEY